MAKPPGLTGHHKIRTTDQILNLDDERASTGATVRDIKPLQRDPLTIEAGDVSSQYLGGM